MREQFWEMVWNSYKIAGTILIIWGIYSIIKSGVKKKKE